MLLRRIERRKNGKTHLYWSVVENKCLDCGRVVQRHVLYLGDARVPRNVASRFPDHDLANARDFGAINFVGQDQLVAGGGVAQSGRGVRYRRRRLPDAGLVPRGSWRVVSADDAWCGCGCPKCACIVRDSGALAGWPACCGASCNSTGSGPSACPRAGSERVGTRFFKCWSPTG
jgi:hypothetical protein